MHQLIFWSNFRIIDQYLVLVWADLHLCLTFLQQYLSAIISVQRCNAPNVLRIHQIMIYLTSSLWGGRGGGGGGGGGRPAPPPKLKSLILPLRSWDQCNFNHCCKLSILWKFEQDWTTLRNLLGWSPISLYTHHLHSQYISFGLNMYFPSNTLLNSLLLVPTLVHQVVYWLTCALLGKFWEHLNPAPQPRQLQVSLSSYVTPIITTILDVILKPMQLDLVCTSWFSGQISEL